MAFDDCEPCEKEAPVLSDADITARLRDAPGWRLEKPAGQPPRLVKTFAFEKFRQAVNFSVLLADRADRANHHPTVILELWEGGTATVAWWTHHLQGLNKNDFIMATKTDEIYRAGAWKPTPGLSAVPPAA